MKTVDEWSQEFDLLYNNITSNKAPGIEEYEKSVFLTRAQNSVVIALYRGSLGDAFEVTEEVTAYLGSLVKQADCAPVTTGEASEQKLSDKSYIYKNPKDLLFRTWEGCKITVSDCGSMDAAVEPITQDEYWKTIRNPFRKPNSRKVLRLSFADEFENNDPNKFTYSELISDYPIETYTVRYLAKPNPIILVPLTGGLSIDGKTEAAACELNEALHYTILAEAVKMAKAVWTM